MNAHRLVARQNPGLRMRFVGFGSFALLLAALSGCGLAEVERARMETGDVAGQVSALRPPQAGPHLSSVRLIERRPLCRIDADRARPSRRSAGALSPRGRGNAAAGRDRRGGGTGGTHRGGDRPRGAVYRSPAPRRRYGGRRSARESPWRGRTRRVVAGRRHLDRSARRSARCLDRAVRLRVALRCGQARNRDRAPPFRGLSYSCAGRHTALHRVGLDPGQRRRRRRRQPHQPDDLDRNGLRPVARDRGPVERAARSGNPAVGGAVERVGDGERSTARYRPGARASSAISTARCCGPSPCRCMSIRCVSSARRTTISA